MRKSRNIRPGQLTSVAIYYKPSHAVPPSQNNAGKLIEFAHVFSPPSQNNAEQMIEHARVFPKLCREVDRARSRPRIILSRLISGIRATCDSGRNHLPTPVKYNLIHVRAHLRQLPSRTLGNPAYHACNSSRLVFYRVNMCF